MDQEHGQTPREVGPSRNVIDASKERIGLHTGDLSRAHSGLGPDCRHRPCLNSIRLPIANRERRSVRTSGQWERWRWGSSALAGRKEPGVSASSVCYCPRTAGLLFHTDQAGTNHEEPTSSSVFPYALPVRLSSFQNVPSVLAPRDKRPRNEKPRIRRTAGPSTQRNPVGDCRKPRFAWSGRCGI